MEKIKLVHRVRNEKDELFPISDLGMEKAKKVHAYHSSFPGYEPTPLVKLQNLSKKLGVKGFYVKDESYRFGLNAFKVLGSSHAIGNYIAKKLNMDLAELPYEKLVSKEIKEKLGEITFIAASDGNHARGVSWTANKLQQKCKIYMAKGTVEERVKNVELLGADVTVSEHHFDEAAREAFRDADKNGWTMIQGVSRPGFEDMPQWIMEGYTTMGKEIVDQLNGEKPTHLFVQAAIGVYAGSITAFFADCYKEDKPIITVVEPTKAACVFKSAEINDGERHFETGEMDTIANGLANAEPSPKGWEIFKSYAENYISVPDYVAAKGMRVLGNPLKGDTKVISGASGAISSGAIYEIINNPEYQDIKETLKIDENSVIVCISTEGDTDTKIYREIVWDGIYSSK